MKQYVYNEHISINHLQQRITDVIVINSVTLGALDCVWKELEHSLDVFTATQTTSICTG